MGVDWCAIFAWMRSRSLGRVSHEPWIDQRGQPATAESSGVERNGAAINADRRCTAAIRRGRCRPAHGNPPRHGLAAACSPHDFADAEEFSRPRPRRLTENSFGHVERGLSDGSSGGIFGLEVDAERMLDDADGFEARGRFQSVLDERAIEIRHKPGHEPRRRRRGDGATLQAASEATLAASTGTSHFTGAIDHSDRTR